MKVGSITLLSVQCLSDLHNRTQLCKDFLFDIITNWVMYTSSSGIRVGRNTTTVYLVECLVPRVNDNFDDLKCLAFGQITCINVVFVQQVNCLVQWCCFPTSILLVK